MMNIKIYQINADRDGENMVYMRLDQLDGPPDKAIYDCVYSGEVSCGDLEDVFFMFNYNRPPTFRGRSLSVSDIVETNEGLFYCDAYGFRKIEWREK